MLQRIKRNLNSAVPNYLSWILLITALSACLILIFFNIIKLKQSRNERFILFPVKYGLTKTWCKLTKGYFIDTTKYYYPINPSYDFKCIPHYADEGRPCNYSNQCSGSCVATLPNEDYEAILKKCSRLANTQVWGNSIYTENYSCSDMKFSGKCSKFKWERNPELNGSIISNHIELGIDM